MTNSKYWGALICLLLGVSFIGYAGHSQYKLWWNSAGGFFLGIYHALTHG